ncbi:MAG: sel1 repeat family protein [Alphaproteobacteria bacterium]|nr:sel1 repeat family protein [Alphaproteobacteria bacterium]
MKQLFIFALCVFIACPALSSEKNDVSFLLEDVKNNSDTATSEENDKNSIFSFLNFGSKHKKNIQSKEDTIATTQRLADEGDVNAQLFLGYSYLYGTNGIEIDYKKAHNYYTKAALQGNPIALNNLGSLYYGGLGVSRSSSKAVALFSQAAALDNAEAAVNLAFILISGNGADKDEIKAMTYFEKAAKANNPIAQFMLGYAYYTGKLRPKNYNLAASLIKHAAQSGFDEAQYVLSNMYINGWGVPQNYGLAVNYLHKAVDQGRVDAMMLLGDILAEGTKYTQDVYTAHILFNLAAVKNIAGAAERRAFVEKRMKIDVVLQAQEAANKYKANLSELTSYVRETFGADIRNYIEASQTK